MWAYDPEVQPPAPFLDIVVHPPQDPTQAVRVRAKIDTAADISAIPTTLVAQLRLPIVSKLTVEGYDGVPATVFTYSVLMEVAEARFRSREVIAIPELYVLLGRDVLNHFYIHLNGPELTFSLSLTPS